MYRIIVLLLLVVVQCSAGEKKTSDSEFNMAVQWLGANLEPTSGWNGWTLARCAIGENLVQYDENMELKYAIAESYKIVDNYTTVFKIRKGVKFHNGKVVDAESCKKSLERSLSLITRNDMKLPIESISATGQLLTIKTSVPYGIIINILADPLYIIVDVDAASEGNFKNKPICTGPFKVVDFISGKGMTLEVNNEYWDECSNVDIVNVRLVKDSATRTLALQSGELDYASSLTVEDLDLFKSKENFSVQKGSNLRIIFVRFNMDKPYFKDFEFRKALRYGIDKKTYAEHLVHSTCAEGPFTNLLSFGHKGGDTYLFNPRKARDILDKAGYIDTDGDGIREYEGKNICLKYVSPSNHDVNKNIIGTAIKSQYKDIGIEVELLQVDNSSELQKQGEFDMIRECWVSAPTADPQYLFDLCFKTGGVSNYGHYSSEKFDDICNKLKLAEKTEDRIELGIMGCDVLINELPAVFLYYQEGTLVFNNKFTGIFRSISDLRYIDNRLKVKTN